MNCSQANSLSINDFLDKLGFKGRPNGKNYTWYKTPYREDKKPSFCVFTDSNKWHDHATGESGDLVNLVQKIYSCDATKALQILSDGSPIQPKNSFFLNKQSGVNDTEPKMEYKNIKIGAVTNRFLIEYLLKRGITDAVWKSQKNLFQMEYTATSKAGKLITPTNLAWKTDSASYELRGTTNFKATFGHKDITTIPGTGTDLNIFEGFFDYMSALVYFKTTKLKNTTIVLNSLSNIKKARPAIDKAEIVNLFLDNDTAGIGAANNLQATLGNCINRSKEFYPNHHDFNDLIKAKLNLKHSNNGT